MRSANKNPRGISMFRHSLIAVVITLFWANLHADEAVMGPAIKSGGAAFSVPNRTVPLIEDHHYRVVYDVSRTSSDASDGSVHLELASRFLNMHAQNGVPLEKMDIAVVVYAGAAKVALSDEEYLARYGVRNPNSEVISELAAAGVRFYACGQSMAKQDMVNDDLSEPFEVGLSAMTVLVTLQQQGFVAIK